VEGEHRQKEGRACSWTKATGNKNPESKHKEGVWETIEFVQDAGEASWEPKDYEWEEGVVSNKLDNDGVGAAFGTAVLGAIYAESC